MDSVQHAREVVLRVKNDMGILGEISRLIAERGLDIRAVSGSVDESVCTLKIITEDHQRTVDLLREHAYNPVESDVILVELPHKPGMLKKLARRLGSEGIDIRGLYATASAKDSHCLIALHTTHDAKALVALSGFVPESV